MNKQALAFLTMFSLILMLSVYYVTLPADATSVMGEDKTAENKSKDAKTEDPKEETKEKTDETKTDTKEKEETNKDTTTSNEDKAVALQTQINQKKETQINKSSDIVSNKESKEESKKEALATIDELKNDKALQSQLVDILQKDGYKTAVEIDKTTCIINVFDQKDDKEIAKKVMKKASELTNNKYLVEVAFK